MFHHPYHRLPRPDVTDQSARFRKFLLGALIALSGSRPTERLWGRAPRPALFGPLPPSASTNAGFPPFERSGRKQAIARHNYRNHASSTKKSHKDLKFTVTSVVHRR
jgi:hypothetical protein